MWWPSHRFVDSVPLIELGTELQEICMMDLNELAMRLWHLLLIGTPLLAWCCFWLFAVNWKKAWSVLAQGAWMPLVLLTCFVPFVWSRIQWTNCTSVGTLPIPNFWWQFITVLLYVGVAFFCGWLQGYFHLSPFEMEIEPAVEAHGDGHGHGHH